MLKLKLSAFNEEDFEYVIVNNLRYAFTKLYGFAPNDGSIHLLEATTNEDYAAYVRFDVVSSFSTVEYVYTDYGNEEIRIVERYENI